MLLHLLQNLNSLGIWIIPTLQFHHEAACTETSFAMQEYQL